MNLTCNPCNPCAIQKLSFNTVRYQNLDPCRDPCSTHATHAIHHWLPDRPMTRYDRKFCLTAAHGWWQRQPPAQRQQLYRPAELTRAGTAPSGGPASTAVVSGAGTTHHHRTECPIPPAAGRRFTSTSYSVSRVILIDSFLSEPQSYRPFLLPGTFRLAFHRVLTAHFP